MPIQDKWPVHRDSHHAIISTEQQFRALIENSLDVIIPTDKEGKAFYARSPIAKEKSFQG